MPNRLGQLRSLLPAFLQSRPGQRPYLQLLFPGAIATVIMLGTSYLGVWQPLELLSYNQLLRARNVVRPQSWDERVVVIAIDERSLKEYGRYPWSRDRYSKLLQVLDASQPAVVGFDILFTETSAQDAAFAETMQFSGNVVLAIAADRQGQALDVVPELAQVSAQGHVYNAEDADGISRRQWLSLGPVPSLGGQMFQLYRQNLQHTTTIDPKVQSTLAPVPPAPTAAMIWLNWLGAIATVPTYSFVDVAEGRVDPQFFQNKLVLVGLTATGFDPLQTPFDQLPPVGGVYLHATVLDNLLQQRWLRPTPWWANWLSVLALGLLTSWALTHQTLNQRLVTIAGLVVVWWLGALCLLSFTYRWPLIAVPIGTVLLTATGIQLREQHEKQQLMELFAQHVAPETAQLLWRRKAEIFQNGALQPQELVATILFMDIRGFTSISEKLAPNELLVWVNRYLASMTECIMEHGGVIDKYIGDAIMAVFGVPFVHTTPEAIRQDAIQAIAASLAMYDRLQALNAEFAAEAKPLITFGIGVHTGLVVAGSVGGSGRLSYSVLGDAVNVAARLEAMNKNITTHNPYNLLITDETRAYIHPPYQTKPVSTLQLRGRVQPTGVYAVIGKMPDIDSDT